MQFRFDINGLRSFALLAVLIFHFKSNWLSGGFSGVDVFFVISGFLMTSIIFEQLKNNTFSLKAFYYSRAKRIVPPLAALCIVLLIYGWFNVFPSDYRALAKDIAASLGFVSNFIYSNENGYFTAAVQEKWLLHTWSLSVEWQFYLLYPLLLLQLNKRFSFNNVRLILIMLTIVGVIVSYYGSLYLPQKSYFYLPTRAWELLAGGLVYLYPIKSSQLTRKPIELTGLLLILIGYLYLSPSLMWPSLYTLIPIAGASLILLANCQSSIITNNWLLQKIGSASYSIYLWHWPVCVYFYLNGFTDNYLAIFLGIVISFVFGFSSYYLIEKNYILKLFKLNMAKSFKPWLVGLIASIVIYQFGGVISPFRPISESAQAKFIEQYKHINLGNAYLDECNVYHSLKKHGKGTIAQFCNHNKDNKEGGIFLWGDSHAQALSLGIRNNLPNNIPFYQVASSGCKPSMTSAGSKSTIDKACDISNKVALDSISRLKPNVVILAQVNQHERTNWQAMTIRLKNLGVKHVLLVGPEPQWRPSLPYVITQRHWHKQGAYIKDRGLDKNVLFTNQILKNEAKNFEFVSIIDRLCNKNQECLSRLTNGKLLVFDYGHLTPEASDYVVKKVIMPKVNLLLIS